MKCLKIWLFLCIIPSAIYAQQKRVCLGAYYFDGWTGAYSYHITDQLKNQYPERESKWGWITSTQEAMDGQIKAASDAGLSFFSFCWYFNGPNQFKKFPLNHALSLYYTSTNNNLLKFCLLAVNTKGFEINRNNWSFVVDEWINQFSSSHYLRQNNRPLVIIYSLKSFVDGFGSEYGVKVALDSLRSVALRKGLGGVNIAVCVPAENNSISQAQNCGFDILTGYNDHGIGFRGNQKTIPIDSLISASSKIWNKFNNSKLPYIPVTTLNWDPRPWALGSKFYTLSPRYTGFSSKSVYNSVKTMCTWLKTAQNNSTPEKLGLIYAWNEYGEGAWLTPAMNSSDNLLDGVKNALTGNVYQK